MNPRSPARRLGRLLLLHLAQGFVPWRWLLVPAGVAVIALFVRSWVTFDYVRQVPRDVNLWDLLPKMLAERPGLLWAFGMGFMLVTGDALARGRVSGMAALSLLRAPSRTRWWASRLATVGLQAASYVTIATATVLLVAAVSLPFSLEPSPTAQTQVLEEMLYPRWQSLSMPVFSLAIAARAVLGLWLVGSLLELTSLFFRSPMAPLVGATGWLILSMDAIPYARLEGLARWLDLSCVISYTDFLEPYGASVGTFLLGWTAVMLAILFTGAVRLRRMDI